MVCRRAKNFFTITKKKLNKHRLIMENWKVGRFFASWKKTDYGLDCWTDVAYIREKGVSKSGSRPPVGLSIACSPFVIVFRFPFWSKTPASHSAFTGRQRHFLLYDHFRLAYLWRCVSFLFHVRNMAINSERWSRTARFVECSLSTESGTKFVPRPGV